MQTKDNAVASPNNDEISISFKKIISKNLRGKTIITLSKLLVDIIKDDSQSQVKDLSVDILLILKSILQVEGDYAALEKYESFISSLPNFRVNMIISGKTKTQTDNTNSEREYKANLNKIKSNLQNFSRNKSQQKTGRIDTAQSITNDGKFNHDNKMKNKLNKNRNKINESNISNYEENENETSLKRNNFKKINPEYLIKNKLSANNNTTLKNEDSKYAENNISEDEEENNNNHNYNYNNKNLKINDQNIKSPNIKLVSKKGVKENPEDNKDKHTNKKKINFDDGASDDKFKKIKQKERDEKVKKELTGKKLFKEFFSNENIFLFLFIYYLHKFIIFSLLIF